MGSIKIHEIDSTSSEISYNENVVYVPGYANIGPINTPTVCSTINSFREIFGSLPYKFKSQQAFPDTNFDTNAKVGGQMYAANSYERSYIYATELLNQGLVVMYERVFNDSDSNLTKWVATREIKDSTNTTKMLTIKAKTPGRNGTLIKTKLTKATVSSVEVYTLSISRTENSDMGVESISNTDIQFTLTATTGYTLYSDIQSDLVDFVWETTVSSLAVDASAVVLALSNSVLATDDEFIPQDMYDKFSASTSGSLTFFTRFQDKGEYILKYITTGAYPVFEYKTNSKYEVATNLIQSAAIRGDCTALLDHTPNNDRDLTDSNSVFNAINTFTVTQIVNATITPNEDAFTFATMMTPYATYQALSDGISGNQYELPASFGYLFAFAQSLQKSNPDYLAIAGVSRGIPSTLMSLSQNITNAIADSYQTRVGDTNPTSINAITNIKPYGYTIWGNRTLRRIQSTESDLKALAFLNIRQLTNDIKKVSYTAAKYYTFENNSDILWLNFKSLITPTLDLMVSNSGIEDYRIKKVTTTKKATVNAKIELVPIEPVEDWDITVELTDSITEE